MPIFSGSGTISKKMKIATPYSQTAMIRSVAPQLLFRTVSNQAESWIPTIFPKLLAVAQNPIKVPLFFLGNQLLRIETKLGNRAELKTPRKANTMK